MRRFFVLSLLSVALDVAAGLTASNLEKHVDVLALNFNFNPVKAAYWTNYPHHRRTPFAVSPDGKTAYLAYLDSSETDVHVQQLDPSTFQATGTTVTVAGGKEAGGLIAHNDGFALLTNEAMPSGTSNAPPSDTPVPVLYRYTNGKQTWKTWLGGPGVHEADGLSASPDLNGDLAYSESAKMYGAYFVVTDYAGSAQGHFGDSIQYVSDSGTLVTIPGASSSWGCSHNTGIAICSEDQGAIWLNTKTQGMSNTGVKISNENTTNGGSGEPMGGMSGSYSALARFADSARYIFAWVSRGAMDVTENSWMGAGYTHVNNRTNGRNVAIALFTDKYTKVGAQATSQVGAEDGDSQVTWITSGSNDCSNAHAATFGADSALITWEEISNPTCDYIAMGCRGQFAGSFFQQVDSSGKKVGEALTSTDTYVAGDMVTMADGRVCWPYVSMTWDLSQPVGYSSSTTKKMSFACISLGGASSSSNSSSSAASSASSASSASDVVTPKEEDSSSAPATATPEAGASSEPAAAPTGASSASSDSTVNTDTNYASEPAAQDAAVSANADTEPAAETPAPAPTASSGSKGSHGHGHLKHKHPASCRAK
ncbi:uncharacterized protein P174DRAFT_449327 [Aspergillus novofumigatus IBT 16806]|uniref:Uncharacterized protein n=1 Tax=Aspergillus novofumigatus (strain IBT 16806) TaxID=1392255 RepID=A0A2I1CJI0_ASPN1|nr:uncharacterized protein P174DRAFT_449327 [Aspergillus novofumigatus IBT 16806]PKX97764.1 hypothetical protein P174DRAFT_449327 [Aspergillus novofumigatus IBT 16806]